MSDSDHKTSEPRARIDAVNYITSPVVKLLVGKEKKEFLVHKALLIDASPYFKACFESGFREAETLEVSLEQEEEKIVLCFVSWLYNDQIPAKFSDNVELSEIWDGMILLYKLAHEFMISDLQNAAIDYLRKHAVELSEDMWSVWGLEQTVQHGLLGTRIALLFVHCVARCIVLELSNSREKAGWGATETQKVKARTEEWYNDLLDAQNEEEVHAKIFRAVCSYRLGPWEDPFKENGCRYHDHPDGKLCERK